MRCLCAPRHEVLLAQEQRPGSEHDCATLITKLDATRLCHDKDQEAGQRLHCTGKVLCHMIENVTKLISDVKWELPSGTNSLKTKDFCLFVLQQVA